LANAGLVGRDRELSLLDVSLQRLLAGRGGVAWIAGEPGIGKSALVAALTSCAAAAGCLVRCAAGDELNDAFPLRLMADCLGINLQSDDSAVVAVAELLWGAGARMSVVDPVTAAAERMLALVDRMCAAGPVVLVVEDLQWADRPSLGLWSRLSRAVDQIPLLLVGSCRPVPQRPVLQRLCVQVHHLGGTVIDLDPWSPADTDRAAGHLLGAAPGPRLSAELARTGGNPLYVRELIEALRREGWLRAEGTEMELIHNAGRLPKSLVATIGRQLGFLSQQTRRSLRSAAVLGPEFGAAEWACVAGQSPMQLAEVVQEAIEARVIAASDHTLAFSHEMIRQVLLEQIPTTVREDINRHVARMLAEAGYGPDAVARQLLATSTLDDWALTWLAVADESAMQSAAPAYESLLLRAVSQLRGADDPRWQALASRLAGNQYWLGHDAGAEQTANAVKRRTTDKELAGRMSLQAVRAAGRQNQIELALALADESLADPTLPSHWRARLGAWKAMALLAGAPVEQAKVAAIEALNDARECQDELGIGYAYHVLAVADPSGYRALADEALRGLGDDPESADLRMMLLCHQLIGLIEEGASDEADSLVAEALLIGEQSGPARASYIPYWAAHLQYCRGSWDDALRYVAMVPIDSPVGLDALDVAVQILLRRDQRERAEAELRSAGLTADTDNRQLDEVTVALRVALSLRAQADGDLSRAFMLGRRLMNHPQANDFGLDMVRLALELGDVPTATAAAARMADSPFPALTGLPLCQALLDDDTDALLGLAEAYRQRGWHSYRAFALEEAAVRLARDGLTDRARFALTEAVRLYAEFSATLDIRRADSRLRAHGIRRGPRSIHSRATSGWQALTPAEIRIASLVAQGRSNPDIAARLYVSRATVQTHVSSILGKLSMNSRIELIREKETVDRLTHSKVDT
jgi:DNA-binding CsgD family transcriptional regulator